MVSRRFESFPTTARLTIAISFALIATLGCVSSSKYYEIEAERDELAAEKAALGENLEQASTDIEILEYRVDNQKDTLEHIRGTYGALVEQLETEVVAGVIQVELMKNGVNVRISEEILFESGSAALGDQGKEVIRQLADKLKSTPYQIAVGGHSDNVPIGGELAQTYSTNWDLAGARSSHVVDVLEASCIPAAQLLSISFGETRPIASNDTPEGRATNRRIEVRIRPFDVESEIQMPDVAAPPATN